MFSSFLRYLQSELKSGISFSLQTTMKFFLGFMFGIKQYQNKVRQMLNIFLTQTRQIKFCDILFI